MPETNELEHFRKHGYVVVRDVVDYETDIQPVINEYSRLLDRLVIEWRATGRLRSVYADLPFCERLMRTVIELQMPYDQHCDISLPQAHVPEDTPMHHGSAVFNLLRSPRLLDAVTNPALGRSTRRRSSRTLTFARYSVRTRLVGRQRIDECLF